MYISNVRMCIKCSTKDEITLQQDFGIDSHTNFFYKKPVIKSSAHIMQLISVYMLNRQIGFQVISVVFQRT